MVSSFAAKLAITNIKQNRKFYLPYAVAATCIIMMFYIMIYLSLNRGLDEMAGSEALKAIMALGTVIIGIFALIFLFYTNSFLMKRRKKEIGLYNILGMEKRHIAKILIVENVFISVSVIIAGILSGILFSKLVFMILCKMIRMASPIVFQVPLKGVVITLIVFAIIFILTLISNLLSIHMTKPIELLHGSNTGEKEPRTKGIMAIVGAICLGLGYYIAITTESPLTAIFLFFVAVILVIAGTYLLFTAGSIAILKALRKNKKFYYKAKNFTAVSGMIYRMKQNAVGLANICILSTMVLVMVSTTVSLYIGTEEVLNTTFGGDIDVSRYYDSVDDMKKSSMKEDIEKICLDDGLKITKETAYGNLTFSAYGKDNNYVYSIDNYEEYKDYSQENFIIITADDYNAMTGEDVSLQKNQVLVYSKGTDIGEKFTLMGEEFQVTDTVEQFVSSGDATVYMVDTHYVVVSDSDVLTDLGEATGSIGDNLAYEVAIDLDGSNDEKIACFNKVRDYMDNSNDGFTSYKSRSRAEDASMYYSLIGGFFFLGVFLGLVFTFAAALIIYYKQISEGYYDKDKFEIMQKIGMSKAEVRASIKSQVLMVFFIPLVMAGIHVLAAFKLITRLLLLFSLTNVTLFAICTAVTFVVFAIIYAVVYAVTAREYYKIVG